MLSVSRAEICIGWLVGEPGRSGGALVMIIAFLYFSFLFLLFLLFLYLDIPRDDGTGQCSVLHVAGVHSF